MEVDDFLGGFFVVEFSKKDFSRNRQVDFMKSFKME